MKHKNSSKLEKQNSNVFSERRPWAWFVAGAVIAGVVAYFLDPSQGKHRRTLVRDKNTRLVKQTRFYSGKIFRNLRNRSKGWIAKASKLGHQEIVGDETLMNRVRSEFGRKIRHAKAIDVKVNNGEVTLSGPILASEVDKLLHSVKNISGVKGVVNHLDVHQTPSNISALQGEGKEYLQ